MFYFCSFSVRRVKQTCIGAGVKVMSARTRNICMQTLVTVQIAGAEPSYRPEQIMDPHFWASNPRKKLEKL